MVVIDAVSRHVQGFLGKAESLEEKRYGVGVPVYTRPEFFEYKGKKYKVPKVLLSGDHKKIVAWREKYRKDTSPKIKLSTKTSSASVELGL
jgi:tRNA (guanine37-N1)-methyltransferase